MKILRAEHLIKTYGKGLTEIRALDDVTLDVGSGEFVAIVGSSGSQQPTGLLDLIVLVLVYSS